ncbi:hypothetical protein [Kordiimonas aestuarii]|uniref:hypothetical protein n=1 Tax=Kordiimonas aestuarii TaxID=1005925 RepID=UPI0021D3ACBF|nr:hypothetical protein [Kordiimonas aestuarii]
MKSTVSMIAGVAVAVAMGSGVYAGDEKIGAECFAPMSVYSDGMPTVEGFEALTPEKRIVETTMVFRKAMAAAQESQNCYEDAIALADEDQLAALQDGAEESNRVFAQVQSDFGSKLDEMSGDVLADVAPAAGPETQAAAEEQSVAGMELLFDSYMALERSQEINRGLSKAARKS